MEMNFHSLKEKFNEYTNFLNHNQQAKTGAELVDRYVYTITKRLPTGQREDRDKEIRLHIKDKLSERFSTQEDSFESVKAVLIELGSPIEQINRYKEGKKYLIGPDFFDTYLLVLKIVLVAVTGGLLIALTIQNIVDPPVSWISAFSNYVSTIISGLMSAFTWVTVIFTLLSHYGGEKMKADLFDKQKSENWKPELLHPIPIHSILIKKSEPIFGIITHIVLFILFNYAPQIIGVISFESGSTVVVPFLNLSNLSSFILLVNMILFIGLLKEIAQLLEGKYTLRLSISTFIISTVSLVLTLILINNPLIWNQNFVSDLTNVFDMEIPIVFDLQNAIHIGSKIVIALVVFGYLTETITNFYKVFRYGRK